MKKISVIIVDDELLARKRLVNLVEEVADFKLIDTCNTGKNAITKINKLEPDLLFLDIQLKDMTGFDIVNKIKVKKHPIIIFVTAFDEFAIKAFDFFAFDYLLKPFKDERFFVSVKKVIKQINNNNFYLLEDKMNNLLEFIQNPAAIENNSKNNKLAIKLGNKVSFLNVFDIKYILASGYYAEIYIDEKPYLLREPLSNLIEKLPSNNFIRIHRSTIINIDFMHEVIHSNYGEIDVKMKDRKLFRVSKGHKKDFQKFVGI